MKITAVIPSRGRSLTLTAAINSLHSLESGKNEITYGVVCDLDDPATIGTAQSLQAIMPLAYYVQERAPSLGEMVNTMTDHMPADVYLSVADDILCLTPDWDEKIARAWDEKPNGVWWWTPAKEERPALYAIVSDAWKKAAGRMFTDYFPFWYDDLWLAEVWILATEGPILNLDIKLMDCPKATHRMRDLRFWHDFYMFMRPERVRQSKKMAAALGFTLPGISISDALSQKLNVSAPEFLSSIEAIEANQGATGEPTPEYLKAKARAELIIKQRKFLAAAVPALERFVA